MRERSQSDNVIAQGGTLKDVTVSGNVMHRAFRRPWVTAGALAIGLAACGGGGDAASAGAASAGAAPAEAVQVSAAEAAAAENLPLLQPAEQVVDFEVLSVSDGSISTLREEVAGDRPVLLWFFSPH